MATASTVAAEAAETAAPPSIPTTITTTPTTTTNTNTPSTTAAATQKPAAEEGYPFPFGIGFPSRTTFKTVAVDESSPDKAIDLFLLRPLYAPLLFKNVSSDARDHCANERTFLSWLRLSVYMAIVAVAILVNFHLKRQPTEFEKRLSLPLGLLFGILSGASLTTGVAIYMRTVTKYAHRRAIVQHGIKTQVMFAVLTVTIIGACGLFIGVDALEARSSRQRPRP